MAVILPTTTPKGPGCAELHFPLTGNFGSQQEIDQLNELEHELTGISAIGANYTGREIGEGEATLLFEASDIFAFVHHLLELKARLPSDSLIEGARVVIRSEHLADHYVKYSNLNEWLRGDARNMPRKLKGARKPKLGDFYSIPLPDSRFGHASYVCQIPRYCDLLQVLDVITIEPAQIDGLINARPMFPPLKTVITVGICHGGWRLVGHANPDPNFRPPIFRESNLASFREEPGVYDDWWLSSGPDQWTFAGTLTEEMRALEYNCFWNPWSLAERIATGKNPHDCFL